jgi:hypothetical protein
MEFHPSEWLAVRTLNGSIDRYNHFVLFLVNPKRIVAYYLILFAFFLFSRRLQDFILQSLLFSNFDLLSLLLFSFKNVKNYFNKCFVFNNVGFLNSILNTI